MRHVYFIRHGQAQAGASGMDRDFFLTATGALQVEALGRHLHETGVQPAIIFSSCLTRARQTAEILRKYVPAPLKLRNDIIEHGSQAYLDDGSLQEAALRYPRALTADGLLKTLNPEGCVWWKFSIGGETVRQLHSRARRAWNDILAEMPDGEQGNQPVLIVSHGSFLSAMLTEILQLSLNGVWRFNFANAGVIALGLHQGSDGVMRPILTALAPHVTSAEESAV